MLVGYARVSTVEQETRLQRDALKRAGVRRVWEEKASAVAKRPVLDEVLASMRPGDVLVVWKLDRLARSMRDLLGVLERLEAMGCGFRSVTEPIDTSSPLGEFVLQVLGAVAQFERRLIRERSIAGQVAAYQRGVRWGGTKRRTLTDAQVRAVRRAYGAGGATMAELGRRYGVSRYSISRVLNPPAVRRYAPLPVLGRYLKECAQ